MSEAVFPSSSEAFEKVRSILKQGNVAYGTDDFLRVEVLMFALAEAETRVVHFKGNEYVIVATALSADDKSLMVIYQAKYGEGEVWVRRIDEFFSMKKVTSLDGGEDIVVPRFKVKE